MTRVRQLAPEGSVRPTDKANMERAALGLDPEDVREVLASLAGADSAGRLASSPTGEWMYVFKPRVGGVSLYVKPVVRNVCVVVSFHEDEARADEEAE